MNKEFLQSLREQIKSGTVTEQEPMSRHTSFSIGGPADVFVQPATKEEIKNKVTFIGCALASVIVWEA